MTPFNDIAAAPLRSRFRLTGTAAALVLALGWASAAAAAGVQLQMPPVQSYGPVFSTLGGALSAQTRVQQALRESGADEQQINSIQFAPQPSRNAMGVLFVRGQQVVDGAPVHGTYVRAAVNAQGEVRHLMSRLVPAGQLASAGSSAKATAGQADSASQALRVAMQHLRPQAASRPQTAAQVQGSGWRFSRSDQDWAEPRVTPVLLPDAEGRLTRGWKVETHLREGNLAHTTLLGPEMQVLQVIQRHSNAALRVYPNSPAAGASVIVQEPLSTASPSGWVDPTGQTSLVLYGNNAIVGLDNDGNNRIDGGGYAIYDGQFVATPDLSLSPLAPRNQQFSVQNAMALVNRIHDTVYQLGFNELAGNMQRNNFMRGGIEGDGVFVTVQDWNTDSNANFAVSLDDGGYARMQVGLQPSPLPTHEVVAGTTVSGAKLGLFGATLSTFGVSGTLARPGVADGCSAISESLRGKVALLAPGNCSYVAAVANAQRAGATAVIMASPAPNNHAFRMTGTTRTNIPAVQVGATDAQRLLSLTGSAVTLRAKAQQPPLLDGALDADLVFHEYTHGMSARLIGDLQSTRAAASINEAYSDTVAFLMTGNDRFAAYSFSESCFRLPGSGCRRSAWKGYPRTYTDIRGNSIYDDGEIYTASMWRLKELLGPGTDSTLLGYVIDGMNYTPPAPSFEQARDGLLAAVANGPRPADCSLVWKAFAQFGLGKGSSSVWSNSGVSVTPSTVAPLQCQ